jgi:hypothetical protein
MNRIARFSRLGKIYKVIKVTKLARLLKSIKARKKMSKHLTETLKIKQGIERMLIMLLTFMFLQHCVACIWYDYLTCLISYLGFLLGGMMKLAKKTGYIK